MAQHIQTLYVVHHSHTDIGYTDLQERVIDTQVDYIRSALTLTQDPQNAAFRWNCETYFCVEKFLEEATDAEKKAFFTLVRENRMGLSTMYLNFNDLLDCEIASERLSEMVSLFEAQGIRPVTAMCADINGVSMGLRDALIDNGTEFLMTNIHTHHGMYPLYQNQNAYFWENAAGKRLLVWNGEHYNLGNALGIKPNRSANFMMQDRGADPKAHASALETLHQSLADYVALCEANDYPYDFIPTCVSGVFSDNAPPEPEILRMIESHNEVYGSELRIQMVSLQELYALTKDKLQDSPVYRGDLTDWWAHGVGSTPYAVKHYRDAQHLYQLLERLDKDCYQKYPALARRAQDHLLLYAEHTWGHSSTINSPYESMVLHLDMRKNGYASVAHEAASLMLNRVAKGRGDILRYYSLSGRISVINPSALDIEQPISFYIESPILQNAKITADDGSIYPCQVSPHPRGRLITFIDRLAPFEEKEYRYDELPAAPGAVNSRKAYVGAERVRDVINDYDPITYRLPYEIENDFFRIAYRPETGVQSFYHKKLQKELLPEGGIPFFTPIYECTAIQREGCTAACAEENERRILGRNIRGKHAQLHVGVLKEIACRECGAVFTLLELKYQLEGSVHCSVFLKCYADVPRIDFKLQLGKTLSSDIESVYLPMTLSLDDASLYLRKGAEAFRPGVDQLPGTCMEYYMSDEGMAYVHDRGSVLIAAYDTPLYYMGEMRHHAIRLCDRQPENNRRPVYSWVMNNIWETNFKMDLSGFAEYRYSLWLSEEKAPEQAMDALREGCFAPYVLVVE